MLTRAGKNVPVFLRAVPFKDKNKIIIGLVWNFTDISEQRAWEKKIKQYTKTIEHDLWEKEAMLMKARHLQRNFIQTTLPILEEFNIHALFLPCENLGGDFFHVIPGIKENKLVIIIGDCTDHGIRSSMDASILSSLVNKHLNILYKNNRTDHFMNRISVEYSKVADEDQFPTMFAAVIDLSSKTMFYSNANSILPLIKRQDNIFTLKRVEGLHLGYFDDPSYGQESFNFQENDRLLFFSDALIEIETGQGKRLGLEGVNEILNFNALSPERYFSKIIHRIEEVNGRLPLEDDTTLIQLDFTTKKEKTFQFNQISEWYKRKEEIKEHMLHLDFSLKEIEQTAIALDEMCLNALIHGNKKKKSKCVTVISMMDFSRVEFTISDEGDGFKPETVPDPTVCIEELMVRDIEEEFTHGRGIWITDSLMDSIEYNSKGNRVKIQKTKEIKKVRIK